MFNMGSSYIMDANHCAAAARVMHSTVSSTNTFDLYKLNMSKDMAVLRKQYDKTKFDLKSKRERLLALERDWDNLHSLN